MPPATSFTQDLADKICDYLMEGKSLRQIEKLEGMPSARTVYRWLADLANSAFRQQYASAREAQADIMGEDLLDIADDGSNDFMTITKGDTSYVIENKEWTSRSKLRVDARKWLMSKLAPKKYGDVKSIDLTSKGERITGFAITDVDDDDSDA
jgi:hypothetical protein